MQRFPQIDESPSNNFRAYRSTDFFIENLEVTIPKSTTNPPKRNVPVNLNRSRSCSGGRNRNNTTPQHLSEKVLYTNKNQPVYLRLYFIGSYDQIEMNVDIDNLSRKITHRVTELFGLLKENQSDR